MPSLTLSGNEITDAVRTAGTQGDGLTPPAGVGIWEQRANLCSNGLGSSITGWLKVQGTETLSSDTGTFKFGTQSLKCITPGSVSTEGVRAPNVSVTGGQTYTFSFWGKVASGTLVVNLRCGSGSDGVIANPTVTLTSTWQRFSVTYTPATTTTFFFNEVVTNVATAATFWTDGVMVNSGPVALPYNEGTILACRVQAPASLLNATQGWVAMRLRMGWASSGTIPGAGFPTPFMLENDGSNKLGLLYDPAKPGWRVLRYSGGVGNNAWYTPNPSFAAGDSVTLIFAWTATSIAISVNGGSFVSDATTQHIPTLSATLFDIGQDPFNSGRYVDSSVLWFACGTGTLSDADAATINGFGNTPPTLTQFPAAALATMAWSAVNAAYTTLTPALLIAPVAYP